MAPLTRRAFLGSSLALGLRAQPRRPNIVLILADDLGLGDLACYGHPSHQTPNLDRMAREGVRFTDFYTPMPFCAPTRSSLLTGRYPFRTTVVRNPAPDGGMNDVGLPASEITIARALQPFGYASICIGKWHLGHTPEYLPRQRGFDEYYGILYSNDMRPVQIVHNERVAEYPVVQANLTRKYTEKALGFIQQNKDRPFFLYLPHAMPHKPLAASEDFYVPGTSKELYASVIRELDWSVGRILARLKELNLEENTLVMFTSDNGPWYGGYTAGLRGMKGSSFDGGIRVPMIARWPGRIPAGRTTKEVAGTIDVFPTVCRVAGAEVPSDRVIDGRDIFPLMVSDARNPHEAIVSMAGARLAIVRSGRWKLHVRAPQPTRIMENAARWVDPRGPDGVTMIAPYEQARPDQYPGVLTGDSPKEMMLFDLEADPSEQRDVAAQHPEVAARLRNYFDKLNADVPEPVPARPSFKGMKRLKGGELRYDVEPKPPQ